MLHSLAAFSCLDYSLLYNEKCPNLKQFSPTPATPRALTIKRVLLLCRIVAMHVYCIWVFYKKSGHVWESLQIIHLFGNFCKFAEL